MMFSFHYIIFCKLEDHAHDHIVEPSAKFTVIPLKEREKLPDIPKVTCEHIEPKTTGLTFAEAIKAYLDGKKIRLNKAIFYLGEPHFITLLIGKADVMSTDWEIIE